MARRLARQAAWANPLALVLIYVTSAALASHNGRVGTASDVVWLLTFGSVAVVGGLIVRHQPANPVGWLFTAAGLGTPLASMLTELGVAVDSPMTRVVAMVTFGECWILITALPFLYFPDGRLPSPRWRAVVIATVAIMVLTGLAIVVNPGPIDDANADVSPLAIAALGGIPVQAVNAATAVSALITLIGIASLVLRWRRSDGLLRRQLAWLAWGGLVLVLVAVFAVGLFAAVEVPDAAGAGLESFEIAILPVVTYLAIVRHRLFDIELVLRRSIVYSVLTAAVVAAYATSLAATSRLLDAYADIGASLVASAVVAVALSPVKERLERRVDRALFGDRRRPDRVLAALGSRLQEVVAGDAVLPAVAQTVRDVLRLPYVAIEVDGRAEPYGSAGTPTHDVVAIDLPAHGTSEGRLLVGRRGPGDDFDARERDLLADLCRQVALVVRSSRLTTDLRRSRERLVLAREQERVRLRRDLHDGLGPVLAGLTLQVDALGAHLAPSGADLLGRIKDELRTCMTDVRRAVDGLRPTDLDRLGLTGVLTEHARSLSASGMTVELDCDPALVVPNAAAEVAAYRIVTEALTNVVRHSGARTCRVTVVHSEHTLRLAVEDDGRGLGETIGTGVGLASMWERADELGGQVHIESRTGGGTRVHGWIPVQAAS